MEYQDLINQAEVKDLFCVCDREDESQADFYVQILEYKNKFYVVINEDLSSEMASLLDCLIFLAKKHVKLHENAHNYYCRVYEAVESIGKE